MKAKTLWYTTVLLVAIVAGAPSAAAEEEQDCSSVQGEPLQVSVADEVLSLAEYCTYGDSEGSYHEGCYGAATWTSQGQTELQGPEVCFRTDWSADGTTSEAVCVYPLGHHGGLRHCEDPGQTREDLEAWVRKVVFLLVRDCSDPGAFTCYDLGPGGFGEDEEQCAGIGAGWAAGYVPVLLYCKEYSEESSGSAQQARVEVCDTFYAFGAPGAAPPIAEHCITRFESASGGWEGGSVRSECISGYAPVRAAGLHHCSIEQDVRGGRESCQAAGVSEGSVDAFSLVGAYKCDHFDEQGEPVRSCVGPAYREGAPDGGWLYCTDDELALPPTPQVCLSALGLQFCTPA